MPPGLVGRCKLLTRRMLSAGSHQIVGLDREGEAPKAVRAPYAQAAGGVVGCRRGGTFESLHRIVDLGGDARPALCVVMLGLRRDQLARELRGRHGWPHGAFPHRLSTLTPVTRDQPQDEGERSQHEGDGQDDPPPRRRRGGGGRHRGRRRRGGRRGGWVMSRRGGRRKRCRGRWRCRRRRGRRKCCRGRWWCRRRRCRRRLGSGRRGEGTGGSEQHGRTESSERQSDGTARSAGRHVRSLDTALPRRVDPMAMGSAGQMCIGSDIWPSRVRRPAAAAFTVVARRVDVYFHCDSNTVE